MEKDPSIVQAVAALEGRFGAALKVADHWEADLMSIGVTGSGAPDVLVYFSTFRRAPGRYYVDLESPAPVGSNLPYQQGETFDDVDFEELASLVSRHLGLSRR